MTMSDQGNMWPEQEVVEDWWRRHRLELKNNLTALRVPPHITDTERYPPGWVRVVLMVSPEGELHAIGGDREPGEGDMPYLGIEIIRKMIAKDE